MEKLKRRKTHALLIQSVLLAGVSPALLVHPAVAQSSGSAIRTLLDRAKYLEDHGHPDIAAQAWQQVLLSDPANREALAGLAKADMQLGRTQDAHGYLDRLKALGGDSAEVQAIESMPVVQSRDTRLDAAVRAARAGDYAGAVRIYQQVFGNNPPPGNWALAYYDTEAALPDRRQDAIDGLRRLAQQFPAESRYSITLGRILTYDPKTRPQGIALLSKYSESQQAQTALQQAERWSAAQQGPQQGPQLGSQPGSQLGSQLGPQLAGSGAKGSPARAGAPAGDSHDALGYRALNSGRLDVAEREFRASLALAPKSPQALSGLGYVRMKQHQFAEAESYLDQAKAAGASGKGFDEALGLAHFWTTMNRAADEQKAGQLPAALADFRQAQQMRPGSAEAAAGAAGVLMQQGDPAAAELLYRDAVQDAPHGSPSETEAWRGLVMAEAESDPQGALQAAARMPEATASSLQADPAYLGALYRAALAAGDKARAAQLLSQVLALPFPNHGRDLPIGRQMEYANLLSAAQKYNAALSLYRQVVAQDPQNEDAWRAMIATEHSMGNDEEALALVQQIPAATLQAMEGRGDFLALIGSVYSGLGQTARAQQFLERSLSMAGAQTGAGQTGVMLQLAGIDAQRGDLDHAYALYARVLAQAPSNRDAWTGMVNTLHLAHRDREALQKVASMDEDTRLRLDGDPNFLQVLASAQAGAGSPRLAMATLRQLQAMYTEQGRAVPAAAEIQYAWLLNAAGDDRALYPLVQTLAARPDMTPTEQTNFRAMVAAWTLRRGNADMRSGHQARGLRLLAAAHQTFPENADVSSALAGAYLQAGQPRQALALYEATGMQHATLAEYRGAIAAALAAGDTRDAAGWLETALPVYGTDPNLLRMAAQYEQARGDSRKAAAYYRAALQMMGSGAGQTSAGAMNGAMAAPDAGGTLLELLAPESAAPGRVGNGGSQPYGQPAGGAYTPQDMLQNSQPPAVQAPAQQTLGDLLGPDAGAEPAPLPGGSDRNRMQDTPQEGSQESAGMAPQNFGEAGDAGAGTQGMAAQNLDAPDMDASSLNAPNLNAPNLNASHLDAPNLDGPNSDPPVTGSGSGGQERATDAPRILYPRRTATPPGSDAAADVDDLQFSAAGVVQDRGQQEPAAATARREEPRYRETSPNELPPLDGPSDPAPGDGVSGGAEQAAASLTGSASGPAPSARTEPELADADAAPQPENDAVPTTFAPVSVPEKDGAPGLRTVATGMGQTADGADAATQLESAAGALHRQAQTDRGAASGRVRALPPLDAPGRSRGGAEGEAQDPSLMAVPVEGSVAAPSQNSGTVFSQSSRSAGLFVDEPAAPQPASSDFVANLPPLVGPYQSSYKAPLTPRNQVEEQLELIESGQSGWLGGTSSINHRSGQAGLDQLSAYSAEIESSAMLGPDARLSVITEPVLLDAGTATGTSTLRQGTLAATATPGAQTASGIGGELQLRTANFGASLGYTPYNFLISNVTGAVLVHPASGHFTLTLSRQPVKDTQLSYAGLRDAGSEGPLSAGNVWGGVISDAGALQIASGNAVQGWYIQGGGQYLTGYHVPDNKRFDGDAGAYWKVWQNAEYGSVTVGANFFGMHYDKNLRYFTYGQGGYFSPSAYLLGNVPVTVNGHYGARTHYQVVGSLGVQAFSEDSTAYFPLDLATQIAQGNPYYPGQTSVGGNYDLQAQVAYAITDHWFVGGYLDANNSRDYVSTQGGFSVHYMFRPQPSLGDRGPTGLFAGDGIRPLKVP
jgi:tetratricopeptide (TPR) repeat protein